METSLDLVKSERVDILDAFKYGFYILKKHMSNWAILGASYFAVGLLAWIGAFLFVAATVSMEVDNYILEIIVPVVLYIIMMVCYGVVSGTLNNFIIAKTYFKEWEITNQNRNIGFFIFKTFKFICGLLLIAFLLLIPIGVIGGTLAYFSESNIFLGGLLIFLFFILYFAFISVSYFFYIALRYEYIINNYRFGASLKTVIKIIKENLLEIFGFTIGFNILYSIVFGIIAFLIIMPIVTMVLYPFAIAAAMGFLSFGYIIKYMNLKHRSYLDIFPNGFLDEDGTSATVKENTIHVAPMLPVPKKDRQLISDSSVNSEEVTEDHNVNLVMEENKTDDESIRVLDEDVDDIYRAIEDITEIK